MCTREQAESGLRFLGLVIFENKLKPGTAPAIQELRSAHLACRMITGDNPLTAVSVARECDLISQAAHVFAPSFARGLAFFFEIFPSPSTFFVSREFDNTSIKADMVMPG